MILGENLDGLSAQLAVDTSWAAWKKLPPAKEFSWDKDEAVYSLRGFHAQHCLKCRLDVPVEDWIVD